MRTIQPIKKQQQVAMNKKNAPFPSATQSEYKQMIDFLEENWPEKTPTAEAAKSEEKSE